MARRPRRRPQKANPGAEPSAAGREERAERVGAAAELRKARRAVSAIRTFYWTNAVFIGLFAGLSLLIGAPVWLTGVLALFAVLGVAGAVLVRKNPLVWSLVLASGWTVVAGLVTIVNVAAGFTISCEFVFVVLWTIGCWYAVVHTSHLGRLRTEQPELYEKMMGRRWS